MNLEVREITDVNVWETFVKSSPMNNFMQSWNWGEYQSKGLGKKVVRLGFWNSEELVAVASCYKQSQTLGSYIYIPRGPVLKSLDSHLYKSVLELLKVYFKNSPSVFVKLDPAIESKNPISKLPFELSFKKCINFVQPETTWMIDLVGNTEEEQLEWCKDHGMSKNYPTYIRKSRKEGVTVRFSDDINDWKMFTEYLTRSAETKEFAIHNPDYYTKQLEYMGESGMIRLGIAELNGEPIVMLILAFYGDEVSCLYSAQSGLHTKLRGPMLLRWECMLQAQREGFKRFNSWGVLPDEKYVLGNPQYGYSNFKRGFGGYLVEYQRTADYPLDSLKYKGVQLLDIYRRIRYYKDR